MREQVTVFLSYVDGYRRLASGIAVRGDDDKCSIMWIVDDGRSGIPRTINLHGTQAQFSESLSQIFHLLLFMERWSRDLADVFECGKYKLLVFAEEAIHIVRLNTHQPPL